MDIAFQSKKLERAFNSCRELTKTYGDRLAKAIMVRLAVLGSAPSLAEVPTVPPERRHQLSGRHKGQFAVDLVHPHRLVFIPANNPVPCQSDGGIDTGGVTAITILEVVDYH